MPLSEMNLPANPAALANVSERYLVFYSSKNEDGQLWCPDCRRVADKVSEVFAREGREALIVYVGAQPEWKNASHPLRGAPWHVTEIPTIIRVHEGEERGRLAGDAAILDSDSLEAFVDTQ